MEYIGRHILIELYDCNSKILNDINAIQKYMYKAAQKSGAHVLDSKFHMFSPFGVSGVVLIAESHLSIHTWPQYNYAAIDIFTCSFNMKPWDSVKYLKKCLEAKTYNTKEFKRGNVHLFKKS